MPSAQHPPFNDAGHDEYPVGHVIVYVAPAGGEQPSLAQISPMESCQLTLPDKAPIVKQCLWKRTFSSIGHSPCEQHPPCRDRGHANIPVVPAHTDSAAVVA